MWKFNPFTNSSPASAAAALEGRTVDIGSLKLHVRAAVAEGGFSCVYLARDAACPARQYALKHIICNDRESLDLAMKEIAVMKMLREHPNVVTLVAHAVFDMGRTKEVLLAMEFCEKSLVGVLEGRGGEYFEEEKVMLIFRDVCNGVRAMHSQTPPIAHRDLKAENVLLGSDGIWKLCDFGSTSTNHKCFSRPEEMGLEEDNIRKHTTPAYRAPEMWDLFRREVISEKVDIWALGCLLYRICYLKSAFDGESKLQILNGNYRIPESPKYSASVTGLIKSMLESSPDARPDIMQVSLCVNEQLPFELRMHLSSTPLSAIGLLIPIAASHEGVPKRTPLMPQRSPPPSSSEHLPNISPPSSASRGEVPIGAFWSTQQAKDSLIGEDKGHLFDKQKTKQNTSVHSQNSSSTRVNPPSKHHNGAGYPLRQSVSGNSSIQFEGGHAKDSDVIFFKDESKNGSQDTKASHPESKQTFQNKAFNALVPELDSSKLKSGGVNDSKPRKEELEAEVDRLKEQLKQVSLEKAEMTSKYENLSAICRSQRQEIQELKRALASASTSPAINDSSKSQVPTVPLKSSTPQRETLEGGLWELQQGMFANSLASPSPEPKTWQAFVEEPRAQPMQPVPISNHAGSVWTSSSHGNTIIQPAAAAGAAIPAHDVLSYGLDSLAWNTVGPQVSRTCFQSNNTSQRFNGSEAKKVETSQPAGWAGF